MSLFESVPEPLEDFSLMVGGGEPFAASSGESPRQIVFGTVVRAASIEQGGELVVMDWEKKEVADKVSIWPRNPTIGDDPNPRGNARGCRGVRYHEGDIYAATYHTLERYDEHLNKVGEINGGLMAGLHEIGLTERNTVWVSSTAIDAALEYDLATGEQCRALWPREMEALQEALGLEPLALDKSADNRLQFLDSSATDTGSHLHLNAVEEHAGNVYALCNAHGVVVDLTNQHVVLEHEGLKGAHNLKITDDGIVIVNDTMGRAVQFFRLGSGECFRRIDLTQYQWVRRLVRWQIPRYWGRELATRMGVMEDVVARPLFVRGLVVAGDSIFVGVSPASILQIDVSSGALVDAYQYSDDVHVCIHGLEAMGTA